MSVGALKSIFLLPGIKYSMYSQSYFVVVVLNSIYGTSEIQDGFIMCRLVFYVC